MKGKDEGFRQHPVVSEAARDDQILRSDEHTNQMASYHPKPLTGPDRNID
jgi:hypothetical protein